MIGVVAVALVGERLHRRVLQVALADTQDGEEDAASCASPRSGASSSPSLGDPDVEVAVGREDHAVDPAPDEVLVAMLYAS